jgi:hypothetical protein
MQCQYCTKILQTKSSLNSHQTKTKYCLKLQGKEDKGSFQCDYCKKTYVKKGHLDEHLKICIGNNEHVQKLRLEILDYKQEIAVLKQKVESLEKDKEKWINHSEILAKNPRKTTTINNINLSVFNKSEKDIKQLVDDNYNKDYLIEGQKGVARFTHSHVLKTKPDEMPMYAITDKTRGNGKYKSSNSEVVIDNGMQGLTKKIHPSIKNKAINIALIEDAMNNQEIYQGYQEVFKMNDDNSVFRKEMIRLSEVGL